MSMLRKKKHKEKGSRSKREKTRIVIRYNVGYDNHLFIRGSAGGLNWDRGVMLKNIGPDEWVWETTDHFQDCEFKVLINDNQFEAGENHHIRDGAAVQYTPIF